MDIERLARKEIICLFSWHILKRATTKKMISLSRNWVLAISLLVLLIARVKADDFVDDGVVDESEEEVVVEEAPKEQYVAPLFQTPTIEKKLTHFIDWFSDTNGIGRTWFKSIAKKEGAEEALAKYNGEWLIAAPTNVVIENDYGLIVKTKARHHAIAASLSKPFEFDGKPLVVQYEVKYEEGQECGGGYIKLLSVTQMKRLMCFMTNTIHNYVRARQVWDDQQSSFHCKTPEPQDGTISEHHAKQPSRSLAPFFEDKKTHLYTLIVKPDNTFQVLIDNSEIIAGNLLADLEPSIVPPKLIYDPEDKKPADWDERETIEDKDAKKPEDWDENAPKEVLDTDAQKPSDWLEDEEALIPDPQAVKPEDWDDEMDSEWEPKKITNPKCEGISGCGKWTQPMKANPLYKGKWSPPKIANPAYKGKWSPKLIENPNYFESNPTKSLLQLVPLVLNCGQ
uniref:Calnexin n=1 Tax=Ditylenchus dipsaci TaxID=166011 RepID=A0A915CUZ8_9BILA